MCGDGCVDVERRGADGTAARLSVRRAANAPKTVRRHSAVTSAAADSDVEAETKLLASETDILATFLISRLGQNVCRETGTEPVGSETSLLPSAV